MRGLVLALTVIAGFGADLPAAQNESTPVTGLWLGAARSRGGLGNWFEFRADGTGRWALGAIVEGTYRLSETSLWITAGDPPAETPAGRVEIDGDTGVRTFPAPHDAPPPETLSPRDKEMFDRMAKPLEMRRVGKSSPDAAPLVGTWQYPHPTGATAFETFTKDGRFILRVELQSADVTYTRSPKGVRVKHPSGDQSLVFHGDLLISVPEQQETEDGVRAEGNVFRRAPQ